MPSFLKFSLRSLCIILLLWSCKQQAETLTSNEDTRKKVEMVTNYGTMVIELYNETPLHRDNFTNLTRHHAFDSLLFHRVIKEFMIQAGDPDSKKATATDTLGNGDAPYVVKAEFADHLFHKKGVLAAARDESPEKSSSAMQFYITQGKVFNDSLLDLAQHRINGNKAQDYFRNIGAHKVLLDSLKSFMYAGNRERYGIFRDSILELAKAETNFNAYTMPENQREVYKTIGGTPHLDQNYTVFGEVIQGLEIIDSIANVETNMLDRPKKDVIILSARLKD